MINYFALGLIHALLALVAVRLLWRDDLDRDPPAAIGDPEDARD
jgi:hypothetical protein